MVETAGRANSLRNGPDEQGRFGPFGGRFVAETLMPLILDLEKAYRAAQVDPEYGDRCLCHRSSPQLPAP